MTSVDELRQIVRQLEQQSNTAIEIEGQQGHRSLAVGLTRPNLEKLKQLAHDNYLYLINSFDRFGSDPTKQLLICEALQHRPRSELESFFIKLLNHDYDEVSNCAAIALARSGCERATPNILNLLSDPISNRRQYYLGIALLLLSNKVGLQILLGVLESEKSQIRYDDGKIFAHNLAEFFCVRISLVLGALYSDQRPDADPFRWISLAGEFGKDDVLDDVSSIPEYLVEYRSPL